MHRFCFYNRHFAFYTPTVMEVIEMFVYRTYKKVKTVFGITDSVKTYRLLLLFGIIPVFIWIDG